MYKILRIITRLNIGGPAIHTILLTHAFNNARYTSKLVTGSEGKFEGNMLYYADEKNVSPIIVPELQRNINIKNDLIAFFKLYGIMKKEKPDIVHTHTAKAGMLGRLAAKLLKVPIVIHTYHGHVFHSYFSSLKSKFFLSIEKVLGKWTDAIIAVSESQRNEILNYGIGNKEKIITIPLGLELKRFDDIEQHKSKLKKELSLPENTLIVSIIARLVSIKNHKLFIDSAKIVLEKIKNVIFLVVGDGEEREAIKSYVKKCGLEKNLIFLGFRKDLEAIYADTDLIVLSSLNEGLPVAIIEAMASAKAVVSTDVGGVKDLIENGFNGLLVKSNEPQQLADAIIKLLNDSEARKRFGEISKEKVMKKYSSERLIHDVEVLYTKLLKDKL